MECSYRLLIYFAMLITLTQEHFKEDENSIESSNDAHEISMELYEYDYYDEEEPNYYDDEDLNLNPVFQDFAN